MKSYEWIVLIAGIVVYLKNASIGFLIILLGLISILANKLAKQENKSKSKDYKIEEGYVIETTKQLPYKIPSKINLKYKGNAKPREPEWTKATSKGLIPFLTKKITKFIKEL